jgi:uncharacterized protein (TIGR02271 family)
VTNTTRAYDFTGRTLVDSNGEKIGKVDELYMDRDGGGPEWALVHTGLFGMKKHFVPLRGATAAGEDVRVPVTKDQVTDAPSVDPDGELSDAEERRLYEHYDVAYGVGGDRSDTSGGTVGRDVSGPTTDDAMTRSEEELRVGKAERETGRARLRKYVVTDEVTETVPVRREEVRVEREPITDANVDAATSGPDISEEEHEVVLSEEEVVADKRVVPKERVRLDKDVEVDERTVSEDVRREEIEIDDSTARRR